MKLRVELQMKKDSIRSQIDQRAILEAQSRPTLKMETNAQLINHPERSIEKMMNKHARESIIRNQYLTIGSSDL